MKAVLGDAIDSLTEVSGSNFSGRTDFVRNSVEAARGLYLYPEIPDNLSGLAVTVRDELAMGSSSGLDDEILAPFALKNLLERNPTELSGGEQASVVLASALCSEAALIGIDCTLEQVDAQKKNAILKLLRSNQQGIPKTLIVDNRLREHNIDLGRIQMSAGNETNQFIVNASAGSAFGQIPDMHPTKVQLEEVHFSWGSNHVLKGCSAVLDPGRIYLLKGINGAGKTTLSRLLAGLNSPARGLLRVNDATANMSQAKVFSYHYQNQDSQILSTPSVWKELAIRAKDARPGAYEAIPGILSLFGLTAAQDEHPVDLPFVLRKRLALAATFVLLRPWMILDEPTLGQDEQTCQEIAKIVNKFAQKGFGFIIITHSEYFERQLSANVLILKNGLLKESKV